MLVPAGVHRGWRGPCAPSRSSELRHPEGVGLDDERLSSRGADGLRRHGGTVRQGDDAPAPSGPGQLRLDGPSLDRKSTRLNSSHQIISYAVFCLKKKNTHTAWRQYVAP